MRNDPMRTLVATCALASLLAAPTDGRAEAGRPVADGATTGYEVALSGAVTAELGGEVRLDGVAWTVEGLDGLRPGAALEVAAALTVRRGANRETIRTVTVRADGEGRFVLPVPVGDVSLASPRLELTVRRPGQPGRTFDYPLSTTLPETVDLLTDRQRYEPGEPIQVWIRATSLRSGAPVQQRRVEVTLFDPAGRPAGQRSLSTSAAGVATARFELPESASTGGWRLRVETPAPATADPAERAFEVSRRTVERLQAEVRLDRPVVAPGAPLSGQVVVLTPSGAPVRGARIELRLPGATDPLVLRSDAEGRVRFEARAPAFLSGDVSTERVEARVIHPAHGTVASTATFLLARVRWLLSATPAAGALVPELDSTLFVSVVDPRGRPAPAGTRATARGLAVQGGAVEVTTDASGLAEVPVRLPPGASTTMDRGDCAGSPATTVEVEVAGAQPVVARLCARASLEALVAVRADRVVVEPGGEVTVTVARRAAVAGRPVLVELLSDGRAVASVWVDGRASNARIGIPTMVRGVATLRARPSMSPAARRALDEPGATAFGTGSSTAVLVRPEDAFDLRVEPARELWRVRERASVALRASATPRRGWAALLARDEAALGGEAPWDLSWQRGALDEAATRPGDGDNERLLATALAAGLGPDRAVEPPPLILPPWRASHRGSYADASAASLGVLRDPVALGEELRRRRIGRVMVAIRDAIRRIGASEASTRGVTRTRGRRVELDPDVVASLVRSRRLDRTEALTLGGEPLTAAMLSRADPSFGLDRVARQVARERLVRLLAALAMLSDPSNPEAARAVAGEPPERWLSRLVDLGMVDADALVDPWGRPFVFRPVAAGRRPVVVVSERAASFELLSPGPDGVAGTADDVRDPFERAVPEGTPYAVASGEDELISRLSAIAPGGRVIEAMARAYGAVSLAALEERRRGPVEAFQSEETGEGELEFDSQTIAGQAGELRETLSRDRSGAFPAASMAAPAPAMAPSEPLADGLFDETALDQRADQQAAPPPGGARLAALGELVRERFPATLFFVGETPFDAGGRAEVAVPLADALTTYRLEAIAWTASGWVTSATGRIRVDQEAMVDAPVPGVATVGDRIRLPVRVANRTPDPLPVDLEVSVEGDLDLVVGPVPSLVVPPLDAVEAVVELRLAAAGEGRVVVRASRAGRGDALDAVRRPLTVLEDARLVRESVRTLVVSGDAVHVEVPPEASERGPGELRLAVGAALFGDPGEWGADAPGWAPLWAAWALRLAERALPPALADTVDRAIPDEDDRIRGAPEVAGLVLSAAWADPRMTDEAARRLLRAASRDLPAPDADDALGEAAGGPALQVLLTLAPAARDLARRPALREDVEGLLSRLGRLVASAGAGAAEDPVLWARTALALALTTTGEARDRAREMVRRTGRHTIRAGDEAWLEPPDTDGTIGPRVEPTATLALARIALGEGPEAMPLLRSLVRVSDAAPGWSARERAIAGAAAALVATGPSAPTVSLDGSAVVLREEQGVVVAELAGIGAPGRHTVEVRMAEGAVALAWIDVRYGLPWSVVPRSEARLEIEWSGEPGARDGRAGLLLTVRNLGARLLTRPVVEVELPAGVELDEPARERISEMLVEPASLEGRTLRLALRPLAPGGHVRIPTALRWSVGGELVGLGTTVWDDASVGPASLRPVRVRPSRGVVIRDRGPEPERPEAEASPPLPEPPAPRPPMPFLPLGPVAEVIR